MISDIVNIDVNKIIPNKNQPRKIFDIKSLEELSQSIKNYGVIQPITVRKIYDDIYEIIAGERRFKAVKLLNMETIPAVVIEVKDEESAAMALIENLQREDLDFIEEAMAYERLIEDFDLNQTRLAERLGKSQSTIANNIDRFKAPPLFLNCYLCSFSTVYQQTAATCSCHQRRQPPIGQRHHSAASKQTYI